MQYRYFKAKKPLICNKCGKKMYSLDDIDSHLDSHSHGIDAELLNNFLKNLLEEYLKQRENPSSRLGDIDSEKSQS